MRRSRLIQHALISAVALTAATLSAPQGSRADAGAVHHYVALGDSLSVGWQPTGSSNEDCG